MATTTLTARFESALQYACAAHAGQRRKGSDVPYIAHLLAVASIVLEAGGSEDDAIAALLHDAVEDAGGAERLADIEARFGGVVAATVAGCTDTDVVPKPPFRARKEAHIRHVRSAPASVRFVVLADKLHNVRALIRDYRRLGEALWDRFSGQREGTLWYYRAMLEALRPLESANPLFAELETAVERLERLAATGGGEP